MRVVGVGDNTVDRYLHLGKMYPGGNAVNVPVLAHRYGHSSSYIGWLADDPHGRLIFDALEAEGVDTSHCRLVKGQNAFCEITLQNGDRVFGEYSEGVCDQIVLSEKDYDYISLHDLAHTSVYSFIEPLLAPLSGASKTLSFDFSQEWNQSYLKDVLPFVDIAILSFPNASPSECEELMRWAAAKGPSVVLVTMGETGAMVFDGEQLYRQGIKQVSQVVDTLGAGDAFASRFMVEYLSGSSIDESLDRAAQSASETCQYYGAFGHGAQLWEPQWNKDTTSGEMND